MLPAAHSRFSLLVKADNAVNIESQYLMQMSFILHKQCNVCFVLKNNTRNSLLCNSYCDEHLHRYHTIATHDVTLTIRFVLKINLYSMPTLEA